MVGFDLYLVYISMLQYRLDIAFLPALNTRGNAHFIKGKETAAFSYTPAYSRQNRWRNDLFSC